MQGALLAHYVAREITRLLAARSALIGADHAIGASCIAPIGQTNRAADGFRRRHRCGDPGVATGRIRFAGQRGALIAPPRGHPHRLRQRTGQHREGDSAHAAVRPRSGNPVRRGLFRRL